MLQVLGQQYAAVKNEFLAWGGLLSVQDCHVRPLKESLKIIEMAERNPPHGRSEYVEPTRDARRRWMEFPAHLTASRSALIFFEAPPAARATGES